MSPEKIPDALRDGRRWVVWSEEERDGKLTKVPRRPEQPGRRADVPNEPDHRSDLETALEAADDHDGVAGVGFVFDEDDLTVGVDLDDCRDPETGELEPWAEEIVDELDSYTEVSPSGTGLHVYALGAKPGDRCRSGGVEIYDNDRFFTVTGDHLEGTPTTVGTRPEAIKTVYREHLEDGPEPTTEADAPGSVDLEDAELLEKARNAENGDRFARLWNGDTSMHDGDHSRADLALLCHLAFWTAGDRARMERLFGQSGLVRNKWRDRPDYRERTIDAALANTDEFYDPEAAQPAAAADGGAAAAQDAESGPSPGGVGGPGWGEVKRLFQSDSRGTTTKGYGLAADIICETYNIVKLRESDSAYFYDEEAGYWVRKGESYVDELIERHIPEHTNESRKRNIREKVLDRNYMSSDEFRPPPGKVNVENGVLELDSRELEDHAPGYYFTAQIRASWPEDGQPTEEAVGLWRQALEDASDDPRERKKIVEFIGYALEMWHHDREKNLFFVGPRLTGKSTLQEAIEALFGTEPTVTNLTPQQIADTTFDAAALREAALNTVNDINSRKIEDTGTLKRVFSGERMKMENKFKDRHFAAPKAKHLFTANWLPRLVGQDDAVYRRLLLVEFTKTIEDHEKDRGYKKRLKEPDVRQAILVAALEGRDRLHDQDGFTNDRDPNETRKLWDSWRDGHKRFLYTHFQLTADPDDTVEKETYWRAYREFAARRGFELKSNNAISQALQWVPEVYATGESDTYGGLRWLDDPAGNNPPEQRQLGADTQERRVKSVLRHVRDLAADQDGAAREDVLAAALEDGIDEDDTEHIIENLLANGQIMEPATGVFRPT